jgi:hypothetical protein
MARRKAKVSAPQRLTSYAILALLGLISVWLLIQQSRFNPAVDVALRAPQVMGRPQTVSGPAQQSATAALLPEVSGFTPLAPIESYNSDNLSDKINGKAELYLSAGFKEMSSRMYSLSELGATHVDVYLYDMGSAPNAYAVFSGQRRPGSPNIPLTANAYATANALFFTQGQFYVEIVADRTSETLKSSLESYATALLSKIPSQGETKSEAALFPKEGLALDTVRLSAADAFGLEGFNNVLTGEYTLKGGKATAFMAQRDSPKQAQSEARRYQDFLSTNGYKKIDAPGAPAALSLFSLEDSFEVVFAQGRFLVGVHDASSKETALELAAKLQPVLKEKP